MWKYSLSWLLKHIYEIMILLLFYPGYVSGGKAFYLNHILIWTLKKREKTQIDQLYQFVSYSLIFVPFWPYWPIDGANFVWSPIRKVVQHGNLIEKVSQMFSPPNIFGQGTSLTAQDILRSQRTSEILAWSKTKRIMHNIELYLCNTTWQS